MKKSLFAVLCVLCVYSQAQKNQFKCFYINPNGDTSKGWILNFSNWDTNPEKFLFKNENDQSEVLLTPVNCKQLTIDGLDTYLSYRGTRLANPTALSSFGNETDPTSRFDTVSCFLRNVFNSPPYKIAVLKDNKRENFYLVEGDKQPEELLYSVYLSDNGLKESTVFRQQLVKIFADSLASNGKMLTVLEGTKYTENDLNTFMRGITMTKKTASKNEGKRGEFVLMAGAAINFFDITPKNTSLDFAATNYGSAVSPVLAVGYLYYTKRRFGNVYLSPQLRYFYTKHSGDHANVVDGAMHHNTFKSSFLYLGMFLGKNWINTQSITWYTSLGYGMTAKINFSHTEVVDAGSNHGTKTKTSSSRLSGNFFLQTGIVLKRKYGCWIGYKPAKNLDNYVGFKTPLSSLQFGVEYRM